MHGIDDLKSRGQANVIFECVAGSRAYGTMTDASDEDIRGIFVVPSSAYLDLVRPADQLSDERGNVVYYSLRRIVELLAHANPNILELLFMPQDCVLKSIAGDGSCSAAASPHLRQQAVRRHARRLRDVADQEGAGPEQVGQQSEA